MVLKFKYVSGVEGLMVFDITALAAFKSHVTGTWQHKLLNHVKKDSAATEILYLQKFSQLEYF